MTKRRFWTIKINRSRERGQSIVEFALLAPVLILLFMGMFDFGWLLHKQIQMDNAVRLGARRAAVGATNADILERMIDNCTFTLLSEEITIDVRDSDGNSIGDNSDRTPNNLIYIAINRDNEPLITPLAGFIEGMTAINLVAEAEFLIE
jgi:hypothetical protein